jgi:hypothetical protein
MERFAGMSEEKLEEAKRKASSHCLNLECRKEQLHILIEKLTAISGQRLGMFSHNLPSKGLSNGFGLKKASISDELKKAESSKDVIEVELKNIKHQLKVIEKLLDK